MFGSLGMPELVIIFVIALIVFGPRKLPELGKSLGKSLEEFKRASNELRNSLEEEIRVEEERERTVKAAPAPVGHARRQRVAADGRRGDRHPGGRTLGRRALRPRPGRSAPDGPRDDAARREPVSTYDPLTLPACPCRPSPPLLRRRARSMTTRRTKGSAARCRSSNTSTSSASGSSGRSWPSLVGFCIAIVFIDQIFDFVMTPLQAILPAAASSSTPSRPKPSCCT